MPKKKVFTQYGLKPGETSSAGWLNLGNVNQDAHYIEAVPIGSYAKGSGGTWHVEVTRVWRRLRIVEDPESDYPDFMKHRHDIFWTVKNVGQHAADYSVYVACS